MPKAVICMVKTQTQAQALLTRLAHAGIGPDHVSLVMADHSERHGYPPNSEALLGLLTGVGRIVMSGTGFFIVAGPVLNAIQDSPQSTLEGVAGALMHFGSNKQEAHDYQDWGRAGNILVVFHAPDNDEAQRIREILDNADVEKISIIGEEDLTDMNRYLHTHSS